MKTMIRLFLSHSSEDRDLAELVVQLFSVALPLRSQEIRCTSVEGYKLPGGADTNAQIREEVLDSQCFVGVVSPSSMGSAFVLFELGARWGAKKQLIPLLGPGMKPHALKGPLTGLNALSSDNPSELHQLVQEVGEALDIKVEPPSVYQKALDAVVYYAATQELPSERSGEASTGRPTPSVEAERPVAGMGEPGSDEYGESEEVIERHCKREWPDDFSMRAYCMEQQREAVAQLRQGRPSDIPSEVFQSIRRKCAREWPDDYSMRQYCEEQQFDGYRQVQGRRSS